MKAIETVYKGYRFRSRLEARWAVFFDELGVEWEYEKEGYDLDEVGWYLPDFWFPRSKVWAEVKGDEFTNEEIIKARSLSRLGYPVVMLIGTPENKTYKGVKYVPACYEILDCDMGSSEDIIAASLAAKQARFEHGQVGAPSEWNQ